ncbi:MAG: CDP-alcohol phosphatidyltransferase family protein [Arcicella sp.]|nr:CDP-alcohol phosphatidyltransferase family protein [Arcicella sp.]
MSKLSQENKFFDVSDYGRPIANFCANILKNTVATPVQVTLVFGVCGLCAVYCILHGFYITAGILLILKSIIDAIDGELSRLKKTPSYTGRYLDSIFDIILNFLFLMAIWHVSQVSIWLALVAFVCIQLQGTLYNYYYVILRNSSEGGDITSKIFETKIPEALPGEQQKTVNILFKIFTVLYRVYDRSIYLIDQDAIKMRTFPNWFMTMVSFYGLGFQLMIMAVMLSLGWVEFIIPFFIFYTGLMFVFVGIRKGYLASKMVVA